MSGNDSCAAIERSGIQSALALIPSIPAPEEIVLDGREARHLMAREASARDASVPELWEKAHAAGHLTLRVVPGVLVRAGQGWTLRSAGRTPDEL